MKLETTIKSIRTRLESLAHTLAPLAPALMRVTVAAVFIQAGWAHLTHMSETVEAFRNDFGVPFPEFNAPLASVTEFAGGILLLFGLGARLAALPMAFTMFVAIATAKRSELAGVNLESLTTLLGFSEWSYLVMFLVIAITGPGPLSLDAVIARRWAAAPQLPRPLLRPNVVSEVKG